MPARIAAVDQKLDRRLDALDQQVDRLFGALDRTMSRQFLWILGVQVTVLIAVVGPLIAP